MRLLLALVMLVAATTSAYADQPRMVAGSWCWQAVQVDRDSDAWTPRAAMLDIEGDGVAPLCVEISERLVSIDGNTGRAVCLPLAAVDGATWPVTVYSVAYENEDCTGRRSDPGPPSTFLPQSWDSEHLLVEPAGALALGCGVAALAILGLMVRRE